MSFFSKDLLEKVTVLETSFFFPPKDIGKHWFLSFCSFFYYFLHSPLSFPFSVSGFPSPSSKGKCSFEWEVSGMCLGEASQGCLALSLLELDVHSLWADFFFFFVAVPEKFLVSACAVSNVSHSKHSLCFLAHKTAEVHPVQWTNYSALSRYLC